MSVNMMLYNNGKVGPKRPTHTLEQLAAIRGAMWSVRWPGRFGPRPGSPDNILAMDYGEWYTPAEQLDMCQRYFGEGYTHFVTGPAVDPDGYHGQYPTQPTVPTMAQWNQYLDWIELCASFGGIPIHFVHPDGWTLEQMDQLEGLYTTPRAQALLPILVPTGWEPTRYDWKAAYWRAIIDKVKGWQANPADKLFLIHTVTETDAPTGDGDNFPNGNAGAWEIVAPAIHGWLVQNGPYNVGPDDDHALASNFGDQFDPTVRGSLADRFVHGYAGWPNFSAWGSQSPLRVYNGECTAYESYWGNLPQAISKAWGNLALSRGAAGALDGCL
jgi:hypothetical protein